MSVRKSSHGTIFLIVSSGSPRALIASSLRSTSKKPFCPMTRSLHPPMTACGHRVRFVATWREEFFEVPRWVLRCALVEVDVAAERSSRLVDAVIGPQIHLLVFDTAPEALEEHVIAPRASAVHADRNLVLDQDVGEGVTRELAALVRVEDLRIAMTGQRLLQRLDAECRLHRDRHAPRQNPAAEPVHGALSP